MDPLVTGLLVVAVAAGAFLLWQWQRSRQLHDRYGREYDRRVNTVGRRRAASELRARERRVEQFDILPLTTEQRYRFTQQWQIVQAKFVDDPEGAVVESDHLVEEVMRARGYPIADFEQRAADISVHHARVVDNYRAARVIADRHQRGNATTEDLRRAVVYYRELFEDLLEDREGSADRVADRGVDLRVERDVRTESDYDRAARIRRDDREVRP